MVQVNETLTRQVADLARLELTDEEARKFTAQLSEILRYVDQLQTVKADVEPLTHPIELGSPMRPDVVCPSPVDEEGKPRILKSAPEVVQDGFKVPQIL